MLQNRGLKDRDNFRFRMKDNLTPLGKKLFESGWELADLLSMGYGAELPVTATDTATTADSVTSQFPEDIPKQMMSMLISSITTEMALGAVNNTTIPLSSDVVNADIPVGELAKANLSMYAGEGEMMTNPGFSSSPLLTPLLLLIAVAMLLMISKF
jgi:hypothetical protein